MSSPPASAAAASPAPAPAPEPPSAAAQKTAEQAVKSMEDYTGPVEAVSTVGAAAGASAVAADVATATEIDAEAASALAAAALAAPPQPPRVVADACLVCFYAHMKCPPLCCYRDTPLYPRSLAGKRIYDELSEVYKLHTEVRLELDNVDVERREIAIIAMSAAVTKRCATPVDAAMEIKRLSSRLDELKRRRAQLARAKER